MAQSQDNASPQSTIMQMLSAQIISRCIGLAANLAIADHLADGPKDVESLATAGDSNPDALYRVLRLLAGFGIFTELPDRRFQNNPLSEPLQTNAAGSLRHFARWFSDPMRWSALGNLDYSVRTGNSGLLKGQENRKVFDIMQEYPGSADTFSRAMTSVSMGDSHAIVQTYDFQPYNRIVDVGGGHGFLAILIAKAAPESQITIYDQPFVIDGATSAVRDAGLQDRITVQGGSYLEAVPGPADLIVMKNIVHGEPDNNALKLLRNCRQALDDGGRLLVIEAVVTDGPKGNGARIMDIEMLYGPGGRQRTEEEHATLFNATGFTLKGITPVPTGTSIVEAEAS